MKKHARWIAAVQGLALLIGLPLLLGNSECQINDQLIQNLQNLVSAKFTPAPGNNKIYLTHLSFVDQECLCPWGATEESELVNKAVQDGIARAGQMNPNLVHNVPGHTIPDTATNVKRLVDLYMDLNHTPTENHARLKAEMMDPNQVDVIVSGTYLDKKGDPNIRLSPMVITRTNKTAVFQHLDFNRSEYICTDPVSSSKKALCPNAHEEIAKAVKDLLESL
jgi:hypothetical protein